MLLPLVDLLGNPNIYLKALKVVVSIPYPLRMVLIMSDNFSYVELFSFRVPTSAELPLLSELFLNLKNISFIYG